MIYYEFSSWHNFQKQALVKISVGLRRVLVNKTFTPTVMDQTDDVHSVTCSNACIPKDTAFKHFVYIKHL